LKNSIRAAIQNHKKVGQEVRDAVMRIGGTLHENIPPAEHIKIVQKRIKSVKPRLQLDEKNAKGLIGGEKK
jgi:DNA-damage-inducible protein D